MKITNLIYKIDCIEPGICGDQAVSTCNQNPERCKISPITGLDDYIIYDAHFLIDLPNDGTKFNFEILTKALQVQQIAYNQNANLQLKADEGGTLKIFESTTSNIIINSPTYCQRK